jgi:DNA-directed RNA polymerase specialized sigma24 family protein
MQLQSLKTADTPLTHEEHFVARYQRLLAWALHLTGNDRALAEDLLHDAYVQFTLTKPDLSAVQSLDGYLCGIIRMLHLSGLRRSGRARLQQLSAIEYDSAEISLRMTDPRAQHQRRDELRAVCRYACARKDSSKAGSVLILRFFHGYYPGEIARVLHSTRKVVGMRLQAARREAKVYLTTPERLSFLQRPTHQTKPAFRKEAVMPQNTTTDTALLREMRAEIFLARHGDCYTRAEWQALYGRQTDADDALDAQQLSHLVSCAACLEQVNALLGLPGLDERLPQDMLGHDPGDHDDGPSGGGGVADKLRQQASRRAAEIAEHEPRELHVAWNGRALGSQRIHSSLNELTLELKPDDLQEEAAFVEVFSEQGLRMLLLPVGQFASQPLARVELSAGRWLEAALKQDGQLTITYADPSFAEDEVIASAPYALPQPSFAERAHAWWQSRAWPRQPRFAYAALSAVLIVAAFAVYLRWPVATPVSAAELLQRSLVAETQMAQDTTRATHRNLRVETRDPATGRLIATQRVELWQSQAHGITARRLYDERNRLIAGEWQHTDGTRKLLRRASEPAATARPLWAEALSIAAFNQLAAQAATTVEENAQRYLLRLEPAAISLPEGRLLTATLVLARPSLRAVEQSLLIETGNARREYRFIESSFEQVTAATLAAAVFQPEADLLPSTTTLATILPAKPNETASAAPVDLAALEIEARYLLDQVNANAGEQVHITRAAANRLQVSALVETAARKNELLGALKPLSQRQDVSLDIVTYAEAAARLSTQPNTTATLTDVTPAQTSMPAAADLRRYFAEGGVTDVEEQTLRFANQMQSQAARPLRHAWALNHLAEKYTPATLAALPTETQMKWRAMMTTHARGLLNETRGLRQALAPIFFPLAAVAENDALNPADWSSLVAQLVSLARANDASVSKAFARSNNPGAEAALKVPHFQQSLLRTEHLAEALLTSLQRE